MSEAFGWIRPFIRELRRRRVIRVAVVYAGTGFVILEAADILQPALRLPSWTVRLIAVLLILGFPLAVGLAWVYNITEEGVVREVGETAAGEETAPQGSRFTSNGLIVGLLILVAALLLYPRVFSSQDGTEEQASAADTSQIDERSIAVLPFSNLSGTEEARPLVRGLHDDLLTRLSNVSALKVISRTSVERYRDTDLPLPAIADSLGAKWIVEGGVQQADDQIQVNAQLIDPENDVHRWANSYQRDLSAEGLFAVQGEIAGEIAEALEAQLTAGEQDRITGAPTSDLEAYRLYVEGRQLLDQRSKTSVRQARTRFKRALRRDSTYALAWSGLADAWALFPFFARTSDSRAAFTDTLQAAISRAEPAARRALEIDPTLAEAHASMGFVDLLQRDGPAALRHLKRGVELKPSYAQAHHWLGALQMILGRPELALKHYQRAVELNPLNQSVWDEVANAQIANGKYKEALRTAREAQKRYPETYARAGEMSALAHLKRWDEAREVAHQFRSENPGAGFWTFFLALADVAQGDTTAARKRVKRLESQEDIPPFPLGTIYGALGDVEAALSAWHRWEIGFSTYTIGHIRYSYPDLLGPVREDPRYEELIEELNRHWGLNPDGSLPVESDAPKEPKADA